MRKRRLTLHQTSKNATVIPGPTERSNRHHKPQGNRLIHQTLQINHPRAWGASVLVRLVRPSPYNLYL